jgi:hypothetical protein
MEFLWKGSIFPKTLIRQGLSSPSRPGMLTRDQEKRQGDSPLGPSASLSTSSHNSVTLEEILLTPRSEALVIHFHVTLIFLEQYPHSLKALEH